MRQLTQQKDEKGDYDYNRNVVIFTKLRKLR